MKIAHIVSLNENVPPKSRNGLEFLVSWLVEEQIKRGHEVILFAPEDSTANARLVSIVKEPIEVSNMKWWEGAFFSIWNTIIAGLQSKNFDIIHTHNGNGPYIAAFSTAPIVETIHNAYEDDYRAMYLANPEKRKLLTPILEQQEKINYVNISQRQQDFYKQCEPYFFKKYTTIHNGIPVEKFTFNNSPKDYLLYIGYINAEKGADIAVQVAIKAKMKLILAGDNRGTEDFFKQKIEPYLDENIQYVGPVGFEEKNKLYSGANALLAPLRWEEPFGLTLVEAQACGTPVIALNKGAAAEVIDNEKTGFVVGSESEMVEAIKKIETIDRGVCRKWIENNFSVKKMTDEYEKLYQRLIQSKIHKNKKIG